MKFRVPAPGARVRAIDGILVVVRGGDFKSPCGTVGSVAIGLTAPILIVEWDIDPGNDDDPGGVAMTAIEPGLVRAIDADARHVEIEIPD